MAVAEFTPLSDGERAWVAKMLDAAKLFVAVWSPADVGRPVTPESLDRAFKAWLPEANVDPDAIDATVQSVGVQYGQFLVDAAGFGWVVATDAIGRALAVRALPGKGDMLVYPLDFVAKRWQRREADFMVTAFAVMRAQLAKVAAEWGKK